MTARKRRRVLSDDEAEMDDGAQVPASAVSRRSAPASKEPPTDMDVDIEGLDADITSESTKPQSLSPTTILIDSGRAPSKKKQSASGKARKRIKKKSTVYSDDDVDMDDFEEDPKQQTEDKDVDHDFMPPSPPPPVKKSVAKKQATSTVTAKRGRPKGAASKGPEIVIAMKDERKLPTSTSTVTATDPSTSNLTPTAPKKRRGTNDGLDAVELPGESQKTVTDQTEDGKPAMVKKKLPTIKKNKSLLSTGPSSLPSTPGGTGMGMQPLAPARKTPSIASRAQKQNSDVNLSDSNVYNMLFKASGSSTPRVGVNLREERRKELDKMRDQAREQREAMLKKSTFDLLSSQDKVSRFEKEMRERNSPARYPAYLGFVFKFLMEERQKQS